MAYLQTKKVASDLRDRLNTQLGASLALKVCDIGDFAHLVGLEEIASSAPFILIRPTATPIEENVLGKTYDPRDEFRILYGFKTAVDANPWATLMTNVQTIVDHLLDDPTPSWITLTTGQVIQCLVKRVEWADTPEHLALRELEIPLLVAAIIYEVWYRA